MYSIHICVVASRVFPTTFPYVKSNSYLNSSTCLTLSITPPLDTVVVPETYFSYSGIGSWIICNSCISGLFRQMYWVECSTIYGVNQFTLSIKISSSVGYRRLFFNISSSNTRGVWWSCLHQKRKDLHFHHISWIYPNHKSIITHTIIIQQKLVPCDSPIICLSAKN